MWNENLQYLYYFVRIFCFSKNLGTKSIANIINYWLLPKQTTGTPKTTFPPPPLQLGTKQDRPQRLVIWQTEGGGGKVGVQQRFLLLVFRPYSSDTSCNNHYRSVWMSKYSAKGWQTIGSGGRQRPPCADKSTYSNPKKGGWLFYKFHLLRVSNSICWQIGNSFPSQILDPLLTYRSPPAQQGMRRA